MKKAFPPTLKGGLFQVDERSHIMIRSYMTVTRRRFECFSIQFYFAMLHKITYLSAGRLEVTVPIGTLYREQVWCSPVYFSIQVFDV